MASSVISNISKSLEKFLENGLPDELPAHLEKDSAQDLHLRGLEAERQTLGEVDGKKQVL